MEVKKQQLTVLFLSMFIFTLGFGITVPVMPYFAKELGGSVVDVGLLMAAYSAMEFVFATVWGKVSDIIGRKPVIVIGLFGFAIAFTGAGLSTSLWMLYASQIIAGALAAGIFPAVMAYIADSTKPEERGSLMGMMGAASGLGVIFGPIMASLFAIWGLRLPYYVAAALGLLTTTIALMWLKETRQSKAGQDAAVRSPGLLSGFRPELTAFFLLMFLAMITMASVEATFGYFIMDRFGLAETASAMPVLWTSVALTGTNALGIGFTFFGIAGVITQGFLVARIMDKIGEEKTITAGLVLAAVGILLVVVSPELVSLILSACVLAVGNCLMMPAINTAVSKRTDADSQGVVMGLLGSSNSIGRTLGPVIGGFTYSVSMVLPYAASAAALMLGAIVFGLYSGRSRVTIKPAKGQSQ